MEMDMYKEREGGDETDRQQKKLMYHTHCTLSSQRVCRRKTSYVQLTRDDASITQVRWFRHGIGCRLQAARTGNFYRKTLAGLVRYWSQIKRKRGRKGEGGGAE
ncbi:hypothetical protein PoB_004377200 [Plakobranchus ocellatus]|uniref:Uncharacterized protein n=1 Tax=Plakobranchus ocellatus TaxID=259542 RepID=A0AAV4BE98_9GAST|nr:hypothetical protein PoB_004377200 [Plakobranchus ocellatus]